MFGWILADLYMIKNRELLTGFIILRLFSGSSLLFLPLVTKRYPKTNLYILCVVLTLQNIFTITAIGMLPAEAYGPYIQVSVVTLFAMVILCPPSLKLLVIAWSLQMLMYLSHFYFTSYSFSELMFDKGMIININAALCMLILIFLRENIARNEFLNMIKIDEKNKIIEEQNRKLASIFDVIPEAIFYLNKDHRGGLTIGNEYSKFTEDIAGMEGASLSGLDFFEAIIPKFDIDALSLSQTKNVLLSSIGEDLLQYQANIHLMPQRLKTKRSDREKVRYFDVVWIPMVDQDIILNFSVLMFEITKIIQLEKKHQIDQKLQKIVLEMVVIESNRISDFIKVSDDIIETIAPMVLQKEGSKGHDSLNDLYASFHSLKGMAITLNFTTFAQTVHNVESLIFSVLQASDEESESITEINLQAIKAIDLFKQYKAINSEVFRRHEDSLTINKSHVEDILSSDLSDAHKILSIREVVFSSLSSKITATLTEVCNSVCKRVKKPEPSITVSGPPIFFRDQSIKSKIQ
ncbi:MAG: Hpt domain-containing protein [Pseudobacteriovorax sp.]|nr:Hpt domain-containing protein [Pseudobacteriovorax sp.]